MIIPKNDIAQFIPQRPPFVMIDNLLKAEEDFFESNFEIRSDNIFLEGDNLEPYALVENIAQTTAAGLGVVIKDPTKKPEEGFLGSLSKLKVLNKPTVGDTVITKVNRVITFENMYKIQGKCFCGEELLLECEMKIVSITK